MWREENSTGQGSKEAGREKKLRQQRHPEEPWRKRTVVTARVQPGLLSTWASSSPSAHLARSTDLAAAGQGPAQGLTSHCLLLAFAGRMALRVCLHVEKPWPSFQKESRIQLISLAVFRAKAAWLASPWFEQSGGSMARPFSAGRLPGQPPGSQCKPFDFTQLT